MIKKKLSQISQTSFYLFLIGLISTILGFLREILLAYKFGASSITDSYLVAIAPLSLFIYFLKSSEVAFISQFSRKLILNKKRAWQWASGLINTILIIIFLAIIFYLFSSPFLAKILAPGFSSTELSLTILLMRISTPVFLFIVIYSFSKGIFNSYHRFLWPEISSLLPNLGIILGLVIFSYFWGIKGVIIGLLAGYLAQMLIPLIKLLPNLIKNYSVKNIFKIRESKQFFLYSFFLILILSGLNIDTIADKIFGSFLPTGSISALNYARRIIASLYFLVGYSLSTTLLPLLSKYYIKNKNFQFKEKFNQALKIIILILLPVSCLVFILRTPLVAILFQRGLFGQHELKVTTEILAIYSGAILALAGITFLSRVFYALDKIKIPALIGFLIMILNIIGDFVFIKYFSYRGLALATLLAANLNFFFLLIYLNRLIKIFDFKEWFWFLTKIVMIVLIMFLSVLTTNYFLGPKFSYNFLNNFLKLLFLGGEGIIIFILFSYLFKLKELNYFKKLIFNLLNYES